MGAQGSCKSAPIGFCFKKLSVSTMALPMGRVAAMKATKTWEAMKVMKEMKAKRVSKIAKGRYAKALVLRGSKEKTPGGLTKDMITKNKQGKVVSKKKSAIGKKNFAHIKAWTQAVMAARKALNVTGYVTINGQTAMGKALYAKAKTLHSA